MADAWKDYEVLDTSGGEKLERWGKYVLVRPDPQVIWNTPKDDPLWRKYDARYARSSTGGGKWSNLRLPEHWQVRYLSLIHISLDFCQQIFFYLLRQLLWWTAFVAAATPFDG